MSIFSETMANVPITQVGSKADNNTELQENEKDIKIPQHILLRYKFGFKKVTSKRPHKKVKRKKKGK